MLHSTMRTAGFALLLLANSAAHAAELTCHVVDASTGKPLAARVYLQHDDGRFFFVRSADERGSAIVYDKTNWINAKSVEKHTTVSGHPFIADLPPGKYTITVERGKEYFPVTRRIEIGEAAVSERIELSRWIDMAALGWYSGETHLHRPLAELPNIMLAEDLNVAMPLTYWVTKSGEPPATGDKNAPGDVPDKLIEIDKTHVIWPRNTEYEIFTVGGKKHTLGAIFVLNHRKVLTEGVPPVGPIVEAARRDGAIFDLDKPDWPWAMSLPHSAGVELFELANNHLWRTEFAFREFNAEAHPYLLPPRGGRTGGEREWLRLTLGHYYTLLNCGFRMVPSAGTASGVHPVPAGFGRVYVHMPDGFSYEKWLAGLRAGRSFVTTGPMLFATANGKQPGEKLVTNDGAFTARIEGTITSAEAITMIEIVHNGMPVKTIFPKNDKLVTGALENKFTAELTLTESGWLSARCYADTPQGRVRFAHTAPWHVSMPGRPLLPRAEERDYLVKRMRDEIVRGRGVLSPEAIEEYQHAEKAYQNLPVRESALAGVRKKKDDVESAFWINNAHAHDYAWNEIRAATSVTNNAGAFLPFIDGRARERAGPLRVLPYPGGRHPRIGFPDGAIDPQRETKVSVFTPWDENSYVVVDVPEALFSNLGLTYLAHTHIPTIWDAKKIKLEPLEWNRPKDGTLDVERVLPNGIAIGAKVTPKPEMVSFELSLRNGTKEKLTDLRVQNCVMLAAATGFAGQTNSNKLTREPYIACRGENTDRWIITAWENCHRAWANAPCPCMHSDPKFPDCPPGETVRLRGGLWFYEGKDIDGEFKRIEATGWRK